MVKKAEYLEQAQALGLKLSPSNTIAEIQTAIANAQKAEEPIPTAVEADKPLAKAGKRSAKAVAAAEEKAKKEERKAASVDEASKPTPKAVTPTRSRLERRGKKFREMAKLVDTTKSYSSNEALSLILQTSPTKFDASVELHVKLNVDPKQADQNVRGNLVLPSGSGKSLRVAVFADETVTDADLTGVDTITKLLDKQQLDFDILIAPPANMAKLGKYARVLGPRGLMPNPKSGTVTTDLNKAVSEAKAGRVEYRVDSYGIIHLAIGKVSFGVEKLSANFKAVADSIKAAKPTSLKNVYVSSVYLSTSMGPSIKTSLE